MRNAVPVLFAALLLLVSGCGAIDDMIQDATRRTISISSTIHDSTTDRDVKSAVVMKNISVTGGNVQLVAPVSVEGLSERIDVARLGLADVQFFLRGQIRNETGQTAIVTIGAAPEGKPDDAITLATVTLGPWRGLVLDTPADLGSAADAVDAALAAVLFKLDDTYSVFTAVKVDGTGASVTVDSLKLAALPVYWKTDALEESSLESYKKHIEDIKDVTLAGTVTNRGAGFAQVNIFLTEEEDPLTTTLVATATLAPGETIAGYDMMIDEAGGLIEDAFWGVVDGKRFDVDFVILSPDPFTVESDRLRIEASIVVSASVF
jgi:hypothetical protein